MKKLIALLLTAVMFCLPVGALGEAAQVLTVTLSTDAENAETLMYHLFGVEKLGEDTAQLLNSLSLQYEVHDHGMGYRLFAKDDELLRLDEVIDGGLVQTISSLVPGYVLETPAMDESYAAETLDGTAVASALLDECRAFMETVAVVEEEGRFIGDTYADGVRRWTFRLDDQQLAGLMSECLRVLVEQDALAVLANAAGENPASLMELISGMISQARFDNAYAYQVSLVEDAQQQLIGASVTFFQGEKQIATLSVGFHSEYVEAVWGYGYGGLNYYLRLLGAMDSNEDGAAVLGIMADMMLDPQGVGYGVISSADDALLEHHAITLATETQNTGIGFEVMIESTQMIGEPYTLTLLASGEYAAEPFVLNATAGVFQGENNTPLLTINAQTTAGSATEVDTNGLERVDMSNPDEATLAKVLEAYQTGGSTMMVKLIRLLPAPLLMLLLQ